MAQRSSGLVMATGISNILDLNHGLTIPSQKSRGSRVMRSMCFLFEPCSEVTIQPFKLQAALDKS